MDVQALRPPFVPARNDLQLAGQPCRQPPPGEAGRCLLVRGEVERDDLLRPDGQRVLLGVECLFVEVVDQHDRDVALRQGPVDLLQALEEIVLLGLVGPVDPDQDGDQGGDEQHDDPGAFGEFHDADDDRHDQGADRAEAVERQPEFPARLAEAEMTPCHAALGEREGGKHAQGVQRDHRRDAGAEEHDDQARPGGQTDDAAREHELVPSLGELARHERVVGMEARQAGEVRERGIRGEDQDQRGRDLQQEEQEVAGRSRPVDGLPDLRQDGLALVRHRDHVQSVGQVRHGEEAGPQRGPHPHQRGLGVLPLGFPEGRHSIGDGFDPGHGGAT